MHICIINSEVRTMERIETTDFDLFDSICSNKGFDCETEINLKGWVRTNRDNGAVGFIEFNGGTFFRNVQLVYTKDTNNYDVLSALRTGDAIEVNGKVKLTPENKQPFEVIISNCSLLGGCDDDYPLQKKRHSFEFLRDIAHLRPRANTFQAVYRVRSVLSYAVHNFFQRNLEPKLSKCGHYCVHKPTMKLFL